MINGQVLPENIFLFVAEILLCFIGLWSSFLLNKNFSVLPVPVINAVLVNYGPYKYVRHPIYAVVILLAVIWTVGKFSYTSLIILLMLVIVLIVKLNYEEKLLSAKFPDYKNYQSTSKKLIPFIY
jgi:protein-S-isoprenylcysteine O-methyltransferase Ste14